MKMAITLADLEARGVARLIIVCDRCPRRGVYDVACLIEQHGRDFETSCGARYPALPSLFLTD
jgi:hypothetical protein